MSTQETTAAGNVNTKSKNKLVAGLTSIPIYVWNWVMLVPTLVCISSITYKLVSTKDVLLPYQAYVHYMPISLVLIMIYFWAINVGIMEYCGVKFPQIMGLSERYLRFSAIWMCTSLLAILMLSSLLVFFFVYEPVSPRRYIAYGVLGLLYLVYAILICSWGDFFYRSSRLYLIMRLQSSFTAKTVLFADALVGDILTSLTKVLSGLGCSIIEITKHTVVTSAWVDHNCGYNPIAVNVLQMLPHLWRMHQCIKKSIQDTDFREQFFNALKYLSTIIMIVFNLVYAIHPSKGWEVTWICFSALNSAYLFYWDIIHDWNMIGRTRNPELWPNKKFQLIKWVLYIWFILFDLGARVAWLYRLSSKANDARFALLAAVIELLRRSQWIYFRVEKEDRENASGRS
ncbi:hypothetical protein C5167_013158 [Papaver somniferum]|uniref:EXS domain-containing protein n=1 Tax=Papaver somniferum TaxID=3469 RepID=A0A4Y7J3G5_PAPSO|nr:hypothetical protein C5167_013158 [Papaver somniferum]